MEEEEEEPSLERQEAVCLYGIETLVERMAKVNVKAAHPMIGKDFRDRALGTLERSKVILRALEVELTRIRVKLNRQRAAGASS
jgi:hypothetical protein